MRWFSAFFLLLNAIVLCSSLMYCNAYLHNVCMLNNILVYVNLCMFWYKNIQCYIVYMNSVIMLCWKKGRLSHVYVLEAKSFSYSLPYSYEHPMIIILSQTIMRKLGCLNVWLYERYVQSSLEKRTSVRIFTL